MVRSDSLRPSLLAAGLLAAALSFAGCGSSHPDDKSAVIGSLGTNNLYSVMVEQDRHKGVITLTGDVASNDARVQAASIAATAAPGYAIDNRINVIPVGLSALGPTKPKPRASTRLKLASARLE
jgi:hyperosmotically inducible protein